MPEEAGRGKQRWGCNGLCARIFERNIAVVLVER